MSEDLATAALGLARVFSGDGRLVVAAPGRHDHAQHVAVEFVHPAVVGARSLPASACTLEDLPHTVTTADALLVLLPSTPLEHELPPAALVLTTDPAASEPELVRWYHVLWELVQVGLEHPGLTGGAAVAGGDSTNFLYPFLDATETSEENLLASMRESAAGKAVESNDVSARAIAGNDKDLAEIAKAIESCDRQGNTVHTIGNGGSSSDAARLSRLLRAHQIRADCLANDPAVITALANDLGVDRIFARQVEAAVRPGDVLIVFSTSGASPNLLAALDVDVIADVTTVTSAGYGGGALAEHPATDHTLTIDSTSVHRIQEAQGVLMDQLIARLGVELEVSR